MSPTADYSVTTSLISIMKLHWYQEGIFNDGRIVADHNRASAVYGMCSLA